MKINWDRAGRIGFIFALGMIGGIILDRLVNPYGVSPREPERVIAVVFDMDTLFMEAPDVDSLVIDTLYVAVYYDYQEDTILTDHMKPLTYGPYGWYWECPCRQHQREGIFNPNIYPVCCPVCGNSDTKNWDHVVGRYILDGDGNKVKFHRRDEQ